LLDSFGSGAIYAAPVTRIRVDSVVFSAPR
jgi:hypothetical protein